MTQEEKSRLPKIVLNTVHDKCAHIIQKAWRRSWIYRETFIRENNLKMTRNVCQNFLYRKMSMKVSNVFDFLHSFFEEKKDDYKYRTDPKYFQEIFNWILRTCQNDTHMFFCILNNLINNSEQAELKDVEFYNILGMFPTWLVNELLKFFIKHEEIFKK